MINRLAVAAAGAVAFAALLLVASIASHAVAMAASAQAEENTSAPPTPDEIDQRRTDQRKPRTAVAFNPEQFDKFVGFYQLHPDVFLTVTRKGDRFFTRQTGEEDVEVFPESATKFFAKAMHAQVSFSIEPQGRVTELVLHQSGLDQHAVRVDESVVRSFDASVQSHIAEGKPDPERAVLARRDIAAQQAGQPDLEIMSPYLAAAAKEQWPQIQQWNRRIGKFESMMFLHVSRRGWDIYDVTYEHGHMILSVGPLTPDHKLQGIFYQSS